MREAITLDSGIQNDKENDVQISPVEDLMREHGILHRLLLIYKNIIYRLQTNFSVENISVYSYTFEATNIIKHFIEEYHQSLEDEYVFPVLLPVNQYSPLIQILKDQHKAAKCTTDKILHFLNSNSNKRFFNNRRFINLMAEFIKMYEPHSAMEDTVVFPAFHQISPQVAYNRLGINLKKSKSKNLARTAFKKSNAK